MKLFLIKKKKPKYGEDCEAIVVAIDELHAERRARWEIEDFTKEKADNLTTREIKMNEEKLVLVVNNTY